MLTIRRLPTAGTLLLLAATAAAQTAAPDTPDYKAGYEAGYKAALEALKGGQAAPAAAPAPTAQPPASPQAAASSDGGPRDWWNHSALLALRLDPVLRHHVELQLSATSLSGNDSGHAIRGGGKLFSRIDRWTNELLVNIDKRHIAQAGGAVNQRDYRILQESIRYDLTSKLYASTGFILERDDVNFIDRRVTGLAGLGYYLVDTPRLRVNTFAGLGRLSEDYMDPVPGLIGLDGRSSGLLYLYQTVDWQITQDWSLQQGFRHMRDLSKSGDYAEDPARPGFFRAVDRVRRYRNVANLSLSYQLAPHSSVSLGVESRYDSNPWPDVRPRDTTRRLSLNLMY